MESWERLSFLLLPLKPFYPRIRYGLLFASVLPAAMLWTRELNSPHCHYCISLLVWLYSFSCSLIVYSRVCPCYLHFLAFNSNHPSPGICQFYFLVVPVALRRNFPFDPVLLDRSATKVYCQFNSVCEGWEGFYYSKLLPFNLVHYNEEASVIIES